MEALPRGPSSYVPPTEATEAVEPYAGGEALEMLWLFQNTDWVQAHETETAQGLARLEVTDLTRMESAEDALWLYAALVKSCPKHFPAKPIKESCIQIFLKEEGEATETLVSEIPRNHLFSRSDKFKKMLTGGFQEAKAGRMTLSHNEGVKVDIYRTFLKDLAGDEIEIDKDNVMDLLVLAQEHAVTDLSVRCAQFIGENIDISQITTLSQNAIDHNLLDLKWACLIFASNNSKDVKELLNNPAISIEVNILLNLGIRCRKAGIQLAFSPEYSVREIVLLEHCNMDRASPVLKELKEFSIASLKVIKNDLDDARIEELSENFPNLYQLAIGGNTKIRVIPKRWLQSLRTFGCVSCTQLTSLSVPNAAAIVCPDNTQLTSLSAPNAIYLHCVGCTQLTSLSAPRASTLICRDCTQLTSLSAPKATKLNCKGCTQLTSLLVKGGCEIVDLPDGCKVSYIE